MNFPDLIDPAWARERCPARTPAVKPARLRALEERFGVSAAAYQRVTPALLAEEMAEQREATLAEARERKARAATGGVAEPRAGTTLHAVLKAIDAAGRRLTVPELRKATKIPDGNYLCTLLRNLGDRRLVDRTGARKSFAYGRPGMPAKESP